MLEREGPALPAKNGRSDAQSGSKTEQGDGKIGGVVAPETRSTLPHFSDDEQVPQGLLNDSAALWNGINHQRPMRYDDEDGFESDVFAASTGALEGKYKGVLGASTAQTVRRANSEARLATRRGNLIIRCDN